MTPDQYLAATALHTAWSDQYKNGLNAVLAVLFIYRTRVQAGWGDWPNILQTEMSNRANFQTSFVTEIADPREPTFQKALQLVDGIYDGTTPDSLTNGALWYWDSRYTANNWFQSEIINKKNRCGNIGTVILFNEAQP